MSRAQELRAVDTSRDIMYSKAADARMSAAAYTLMLRGLPAVTPFSMASIKEMIEQPAMAGSTGAKVRRARPQWVSRDLPRPRLISLDLAWHGAPHRRHCYPRRKPQVVYMRPQCRKGEDGEHIEGDFNGMVLVKIQGALPARVRAAERPHTHAHSASWTCPAQPSSDSRGALLPRRARCCSSPSSQSTSARLRRACASPSTSR